MTPVRNLRFLLSIHLLIIICLFSFPAQAQYSGGNGTAEDPYQISTVTDWQTLMSTSTDWNKQFILTGDLDLQSITLSPVGTSYSQSFTGIFDGNRHIIRNAVIDIPESNYVGLFGYVGWNGQILNMDVIDIVITGKENVGGLAGYNGGNLTDCYADGSINGVGNVGGLVGENNNGVITSCHANCSVHGNNKVGGMVGYNEDGILTACYATGPVSGNMYVGGLVGDNSLGELTACYASGTVDGDQSVGGMVGYNDDGILTACYATGTVSGYMYVGGLVGDNSWGELTACYASGTVDGDRNVGGLVGDNNGSITGCFWDVETSGQTGSSGGKGLTTSQMKSMVIFQNAGWGEVDWIINDGQDYPRLAWENIDGIPIPEPEPVPLLGSGTEEDPYQIWTASDFALLSWYISILDKHITLMSDLDLSGIKLYPIGDLGPFSGALEGNSHIIHKAVIEQRRSDFVGLFAFIIQNCQIRNIGLENVEITGRDYVGALVGRNSKGTLNNCYVRGVVNGENRVGGLVGSNYEGVINSCNTNGSVTGTESYIGGLVGSNNEGEITASYANNFVIGFRGLVGGLTGYNDDGIISSCYATGSVRGKDYGIGGLIGSNGGTVISCYATGDVIGTGEEVGGLVGSNSDELTLCYAEGSVKGSNRVGGLVGDNSYGIIAGCYATGSVIAEENDFGGLVGYSMQGNTISSFWDIDRSGQSGSSGGKGLTTSQMKSMVIFQNAGWGKVDWIINDGQDYPRLAWENIDGTQIPEPEPIPLLGSGTEEDPYQIWSASDFALLSWYISILDKHIILMSDLDLSGTNLYPIGDLYPFTGVFDGKYHVISNAVFSMPNSDYVGLFGYVGENGQIFNLGVQNVAVTGDDFVGGLIGFNLVEYVEYGNIRACYVTGSVSGNGDFVGGLVGWNEYGDIIACHVNSSVGGMGECVGGLVGLNEYGSLGACYAFGEVSGIGDCVGGLVGSNNGYESWSDNGAVANCYAANSVIGNGYCVGGLVGENDDGKLSACYASGPVIGNNDYVGGLVGYNSGNLNTCYATGPVSGGFFTYYTGGLVGYNHGRLTSCYARGSVTGDAGVGGLVGRNNGNITACYSTGLVEGILHSGGLIESNYGSVNSCFWDTETSGLTNSAGGIGKTTAEMQMSSTFIEAGWDFVGETENGTEDIWWILEGQDYPKLIKDYSNHVFKVVIGTAWDYEDPDDPNDTEYTFWFEVTTDENVEKMLIFTPFCGSFEIPRIPWQWIDVPGGRIETGWEYDVEASAYQWYYEAIYDSQKNLDAYGDGNYTIIVRYDDRQDLTNIWFGVPDTNDPIPQPTKEPVFASFNNGDTIASPVTFKWEPCIDPDVNVILISLENEDTGEEMDYILEGNSTGFEEPLPLRDGQWKAEFSYVVYYQTETIDEMEVFCYKYSQSDYTFAVP